MNHNNNKKYFDSKKSPTYIVSKIKTVKQAEKRIETNLKRIRTHEYIIEKEKAIISKYKEENDLLNNLISSNNI
jgi:hypothetical protein